MAKTILIIGGGITGLSALHSLKKKYNGYPGISVKLLEKNDYAGGNLVSFDCGGCLLEGGPNGFLDSKSSTLDLAKDVGLENELIRANPQSKIRYLCVGSKLYPLPSNPKDFLMFPLLSVANKLRAAAELGIPRGLNPLESVYDFGKRRLGAQMANTLLDPLVSGIYAGDAKKLNLRLAFPRLYELEQTYGSLVKAMVRSRGRERRGTELWSFKSGMQSLPNRLFEKYRENIHLSQEVKEIKQTTHGFEVKTTTALHEGQEVFLCAPAHISGELVKTLKPDLAQCLQQINYAPIAVVGLTYQRADLPNFPSGFGYLIPSSENKKVLGVLFTNQIFLKHGRIDLVGLRVMIGGMRFPNILKLSETELIGLAQAELQATLKITTQPIAQRVCRWPHAIPQYDNTLALVKEKIKLTSAAIPGFHLIGNYLDGVSVTDCTAEGGQAAQKSALAVAA